MKLLDIIQRIKSERIDKQELIDFAMHENQGVRGSALQLLAERYQSDSDVIDLLRRAALDPENSYPVMGTNTLAHLCVKLLSSMKERAAHKVVEELIENWPTGDKADLEWFLKNG